MDVRHETFDLLLQLLRALKSCLLALSQQKQGQHSYSLHVDYRIYVFTMFERINIFFEHAEWAASFFRVLFCPCLSLRVCVSASRRSRLDYRTGFHDDALGLAPLEVCTACVACVRASCACFSWQTMIVMIGASCDVLRLDHGVCVCGGGGSARGWGLVLVR